MLFQNWLKMLTVDFARQPSRRDRRKNRSASGQVVVMREDLVCAPMAETLETRKLLSVNPVLVADLVVGEGGSDPNNLVNVNGTLFFSANDGVNGFELWRSDGTSAGTTLVKDIRTGSSSSLSSYLTNVNGTLFFSAVDDTNGYELWRSDGTEAGTTLVKDIRTGSIASRPRSLTNVNGTLFFSADDGTNGRELWQSDGTSAGTTLVKDIRTEGSSEPNFLTNVNGTLFFSANDGVSGYELWQSDGTSVGTTLVKDIRTGNSNDYPYYSPYSGSPSSLANVNGTLFFSADDGVNGGELWQSDGTEAGTTLVKDIVTGGGSSQADFLTNVNGTLFFKVEDGGSVALWQSDGTSAGTTLVKDIVTGGGSSYLRYLTNVNGTLFFSADDGVNGSELWQSDGTSAGTTLVKDIYSGSSNSNPFSLTNVNGTLFFSANDGVNGRELWKAEVPADTSSVQLAVVDRPKVSVHAGSFLPPGLVTDINTGGYSYEFLTNVNGTLFFRGNEGVNGYELWKSDGTSSGTTLVKDVFTGYDGSFARTLTNVNGTLFFSALDSVNGYELWKSDGTEAGTTLVKDIRSGSLWSSPRYLTNVNGTLYFSANDGTTGVELWQSDGTDVGTTLVKDIVTGGSSSPRYLTNVNGTLFFTANDGTTGYQLWRSDGTSAGTTLVKDIVTGGSLNRKSLANVNGILFFSANDGVNGSELWRSDGTEAGTTLVKDINAGGSSEPRFLTNVNGTLFFNANDGTNGDELWQSDGTEAGTTLVKDIVTGGSSFARHLANVNGTLFFSAYDDEPSFKLWQSDGTSVGTTLVKDSDGSNISSPYFLTNVNGTLFFRARDGVNGDKLWSMRVNSRPGLTTFAAVVDSTDEDTEVELTFAEVLAQSDATDADGTVEAFIVQAVSSGSLKIGLNVGSATVFAVGSNDRIDAMLNAYWTPDANANGNAIAAFTVLAQDNIGDNSNLPVTAAIDVTTVADTPSVTNASTSEDVQTTSGLVISRNAADGAEVTHFKITSIAGGLLFQNDGTTAISDGDFITFAEANAGLKFTPTADSSTTGHFTVQASISNVDGGLGGSTVTADIAVAAVADTPSVTNASTSEDVQTTSGLVIIRNAVDSSEVTHFKITSITGGSLFQNDGTTAISDGDFITFVEGNAGLKFTPTADSNATGHFTVQASTSNVDGGLGGSTVTADIAVTAVADTPSVTNASTSEDVQTTSGLVISRNAVDSSEVTHFKITSITGGTLFQNDGTTAISDGDFITFVEGNAGLKFTPTPNSNSTGHFTVQASASNVDGGLGGSTVTADIIVTAEADTPGVTNAATFANVQTTLGLVISRNAVDSTEVTHFKITSITGGTLFQNDGTTAINEGDFITFTEATAGLKFTPALDSTATGHFTVQASTSNLDAGLGGGTVTADITVTLPAPVMTGPDAVTFDQRPTITWDAVSGAAHYVVYVKNLSIGKDPFLLRAVAGTSFTPTVDFGIGFYNVWVRALSGSNDTSVYSQKYSLRISTPAVFNNVVRFQTSTTPSLSWNPLTGAVKFDLWMDNLSTGQQQLVRDTNVTGTSWTAPGNLPMGSYRAWIRGTDAAGFQATWSKFVDFFVLPPVTVISPVNPTFDQAPTFTWNEVPGAVSYDLYYRNYATGAATVAQTGLVGTSFTPPVNLPAGSYRWYVLAAVQGGYRSQSATVQNIFVGGQPTVLTPQGSASNTTPTFSWTPVTGAATYELWVNRIDVATNKIVYQAGLASASFTPTTALPVGNYRVWVRAVSTTSEISPWSQSIDFTIAAVNDEPSTVPGDLLLTQLTVLDDVSSQLSERPSSAETAVASQRSYDLSEDSDSPRSGLDQARLAPSQVSPQNQFLNTDPVVSEKGGEVEEASLDSLMAELASTHSHLLNSI